jgi:hypothetical protein
MNIPGVGNLKNYLKKRWNRTSNRAIRPARFRADPRRIHELSSESPEETAMFRYVCAPIFTRGPENLPDSGAQIFSFSRLGFRSSPKPKKNLTRLGASYFGAKQPNLTCPYPI